MFISTVTFLQHVPLYVYDAIILQKKELPETIVLTKGKFSKEFLYLLTRMFRNHDEILRLDFVKLFETEIVPFFKDPDLQEFVLRYKLFYIL